MASASADVERLGLSRTSIAPWENGARTDDSAGTYEWWYFDAHLADGAKLFATFMNKEVAEPQKPLSPLLRVELDHRDGRHFEKLMPYPLVNRSAAKDHADVRLGQNRELRSAGAPSEDGRHTCVESSALRSRDWK